MRYCFLFIVSDQRFSNIVLLLIFLPFLCLSCTYRFFFFFLSDKIRMSVLEIGLNPQFRRWKQCRIRIPFFSCFTSHSSNSRALYIENGASFAVFSSSFLSFGSENSLLCMKIPFPSPFVLITGARKRLTTRFWILNGILFSKSKMGMLIVEIDLNLMFLEPKQCGIWIQCIVF